LIEYGIRRGLANVMIEVRNDLLQADASLERVIDVLSRILRGALDVR
jgi:predicted N-formylglutamate amidohydrolase